MSTDGQGPVFVVGSMGSGTTLMRLILDSHPDLFMAPETGFMRSVKAQYQTPFWEFGTRFSSDLGLTDAEFDSYVRHFYDSVFGAAAAKVGATRWGDKTPFHTHMIPEAARIFPDAQFIATVRHPAAVVASLRRFQWSTSQALTHWNRINQVIADQAEILGSRLLVTRYEDLVTQPAAAAQQVLDFLRVPWSDEVLRHHEVQEARRVEGGTRSDRPIDQERLSSWVNDLSAQDLRAVERRTRERCVLWGYEPADPVPCRSISIAPGRPGITGVELTEAVAEYPDIPRVEVPLSFENGLLTSDALGHELARAWWLGRQGLQARAPYRAIVEAEYSVKPPSRSFIARVRRRLARMLQPD